MRVLVRVMVTFLSVVDRCVDPSARSIDDVRNGAVMSELAAQRLNDEQRADPG